VQASHPYPNHLAEERTKAGIDTPHRLAELAGIDAAWYAHIESGEILPTLDELDRLRAALGGIAPQRLYEAWLANIGATPLDTKPNYARFWGDLEDAGHLLVSRDEATWLERNVAPNRAVDVFVNMSCGPQHTPHLILDTVGVLRALDINFAAGAGRLFCCGTYYRHYQDLVHAERMRAASVARSVAWGAALTAHMCTNCQNTFSMVERRERLLGKHVPGNVQIYTLLERTLHDLGDRVPWLRPLSAKVLVLPTGGSPVHVEATQTCARVLEMIPGVEVVGFVDKEVAQVAGHGNAETIVNDAPLTRDEVERRRTVLAQLFAARGADTMSATHHTGQQWWSRFSSERLTVRHPISILADALGVASPDRYQAACKLGDPEEILEQTRPMWASWGVSEERARTLSRAIFDPAYAAGPSRCACGGQGGCQERLITVDVPAGTVRS
jgi:transcriptional regulator with XRE-family HTH domain